MFELRSHAAFPCGARLLASPRLPTQVVVGPLQDQTEYFIAEVYYDGDRLSWADDSSDCRRWDNFDDLNSDRPN